MFFPIYQKIEALPSIKLYPAQFVIDHPQWQKSVAAACSCIASFRVDDSVQGTALLIGKNRVLIPSPLPEIPRPSSLPPTIGNIPPCNPMQIGFKDVDCQRNKETGMCFYEIGSLLGSCADQGFFLYEIGGNLDRHPQITCSIPNEVLFAKMDEKGEIRFSIVKITEGFTLPSKDKASFGGCYFDKEGDLVALDLSAQNPHVERGIAGILASELTHYSENFSALSGPSPDFVRCPENTAFYPASFDRGSRFI